MLWLRFEFAPRLVCVACACLFFAAGGGNFGCFLAKSLVLARLDSSSGSSNNDDNNNFLSPNLPLPLF